MKKIICCLIGLMLAYPLTSASAIDASPHGQLRVDVVASLSKDYIKNPALSAHKDTIQIVPLVETVPDQIFYVVVMVTGYELNDKSMTDLTGGFVLQNPDGTLMFNAKDVFSHKKNVVHLEGLVMMDPSIKLILEKKDQRGTYIFRATVKDNVSGKIVNGEYSFVLVDNKI